MWWCVWVRFVMPPPGGQTSHTSEALPAERGGCDASLPPLGASVAGPSAQPSVPPTQPPLASALCAQPPPSRGSRRIALAEASKHPFAARCEGCASPSLPQFLPLHCMPQYTSLPTPRHTTPPGDTPQEARAEERRTRRGQGPAQLGNEPPPSPRPKRPLTSPSPLTLRTPTLNGRCACACVVRCAVAYASLIRVVILQAAAAAAAPPRRGRRPPVLRLIVLRGL